MRFAQPLFLYALPVLWLVLGMVFYVAQRRRRELTQKFLGAESHRWADSGVLPVRQKWDRILWFVILTATFVTLARPLVFQQDERSELQGAPYIIALDASRSMLATDVKPSRYSVATNALDTFFAETKADRIGLITFSGVAYLNAPLTFDTTALRTILGYVNPHALVDPGSSLASALDRAGRFFTSNALPKRVLVIISDGEDLDNQTLTLARKLHRDHQLVVHTIGVGTATGTRITSSRWSGNARNAAGQEVVTKLDETNLRRLANATNGKYYRLGMNGEGLRQLRREVLLPLAEDAARDDWQNYREVFYYPLSLAILGLVIKLRVGADRFAKKRVLPSILRTEP